MRKILYKLIPVRGAIDREIKKLASQINKENINILEIGCGGKSYKKFFPKSEWITTDINETEDSDEIADVTQLRYEKNSFDVVFCISVLEHVFEYEKAISEMHRVLKKNGMLVLQMPFAYPIHDAPNDFWRFTSFSFKKILSAFTNVKIKPLVKIWKRAPMAYFVLAKK